MCKNSKGVQKWKTAKVSKVQTQKFKSSHKNKSCAQNKTERKLMRTIKNQVSMSITANQYDLWENK